VPLILGNTKVLLKSEAESVGYSQIPDTGFFLRKSLSGVVLTPSQATQLLTLG
jgi:hypothetical protein